MTPEQLKDSILWSAIQGKLTTQLLSEHSINEISVIPESEKYFDIPDNWSRLLIKDIFELVNGKAFKPSDWSSEGLPIVRIQNLNDASALFNYYSGEIEDKYLLSGGELLFSWSGTPGTSFGSYEWKGGQAILNQHIFMLNPLIKYDKKYVQYALNGELRIFIKKAHGGVGLKHITKREFENCSLPFPPLEEQHRIVAKIEELLPYVERYAEAYEKLEQFNAKFPEDMKKSILQYAIQGKLVEQRPEEGTAEELYRQIQEEKQKLIKEGKNKKKKTLAEITDDEIPFDIPETWKWVRMGEIGETNIGLTYKPTDINNAGTIVLRSSNIQNGQMDYTDIVRVECLIPERAMIAKGDLLICARNGSRSLVGKAAVIDKDGMSFGAFMAKFCSPINPYVIYFLQSPIFREQLDGVKTETINQITQDMLKNQLIPLPPLEEQHRIVAKIEELLPYCDKLANKG